MTAQKAGAHIPGGKSVTWTEAEYPTVYSNTMMVGHSNFDVHIVFGELGIAYGDETYSTPRVKVVLSPEQAANLATLLDMTIGNYTKNNGDLRAGGAVNTDEIRAYLERHGKQVIDESQQS